MLTPAHVMENCGLAFEGVPLKHDWLRDRRRSTRHFGMLAAEYFLLAR